jgi:thiamine-monophosphate kinase
VTEFTEDELIETIRKILSAEVPEVRLGPGDDAALVRMGPHLGVLTTDAMVEGIHFELGLIAPRDLGYKALTVNVSDVAAMGGSPRFGLVAVGLPPDTQASWVVELFGGLREAADEYAMTIVGGDLSRSPGVFVSVAVTGEVAEGSAVTRSGARSGDRLVVTGRLGAAAGGLRLSKAPSGEVGSALSADWGHDLLNAHFRPVARVGEGQTLARAGATAMMDISDGLTKDLARLCRASGVGAVLTPALVPVAPALDQLKGFLPIDPLALALEGGEDFELLAALPPAAVEATVTMLRERFGTPLSEIGEVRMEEGLVAVEPDGSERPLEPGGWDHFAP